MFGHSGQHLLLWCLQGSKFRFTPFLAPGSWLLAPGSWLLAPGSWLLGIEAGFFLYPLVSGIFLVIAPFLSVRARIVCAAVFSSLVAACLVTGYLSPGSSVLSEGWNTFFLLQNGLSACLLVLAAIGTFAGNATAAENRLREAHERAETLLHNILPVEIAEKLKENPELVADEFPRATILFADIVDFTETSSKLTPSELVGHLNQVFSGFDDLVNRHGLEKIKTIGDAYMVASGLPSPRPDHAPAMIRLALDMIELVQRLNSDSDFPLKVRIGINSGPVVAGVIGSRKFAYDLWGDAVNVAARMEELAEPDTIALTNETWQLLADHDCWCEPVGVREIKGKGPMEVFRVAMPSPQESDDHATFDGRNWKSR